MSNRCRRLPTPSRRERKRPQRIASPASEPVLRPTPTPVSVSLGATAHSAPISTVLPTHLFSVAWLPRILGPHRSRDLANNALWACSDNPSADGRCVTGRIGLAHSADLNIAYSAHRPIEAYGGYSGPLPARYTFELKLAEVPSGPLNSELELLPATRPHIECDRAGGGPVSYDCRRGFLRSRLVPACLRSRTTRMAEAWSMALTTSLRGRPGGRRVRRKTSTSSGRMAHTIPTLIPYSRCRSSIRRT